jgi:MinD superfamily P-loop ATPase
MVYGILAPGEENSGKLVNAVRDKALEVARAHQIETILIDGPPGIGCPVISTIVGVDMALIVTEPTLSGFQDLERIKSVLDHFQIPSLVLINKSLIKTYLKKLNRGVPIPSLYIGKIPFDADFVKAMTEKKSIFEYKPEGTTSVELRRIYRKIKKNYNTQQ